MSWKEKMQANRQWAKDNPEDYKKYTLLGTIGAFFILVILAVMFQIGPFGNLFQSGEKEREADVLLTAHQWVEDDMYHYVGYNSTFSYPDLSDEETSVTTDQTEYGTYHHVVSYVTVNNVKVYYRAQIEYQEQRDVYYLNSLYID